MRQDMLARPVDVAVVIPCRNEQAHIDSLLDSIAAQDPAPQEIVVIDGGSTDGTVGAIERAQERLAPIRVETIIAPELSLPEALNCGIRLATAPVIVRLDGHSQPHPGYIARALEHLEDGAVGVVGGAWNIQPGNGTPLAAAIARAVSHPLGAGNAAYRLPSARTIVRDTDTVPFGCFRRETWQAVGGLNEELIGNEDYEFNYRVRRAGFKVRFDSEIRSTYIARSTVGALALQYFRYGWCKANMLRMHPRSLRWRQAVPALFAPLTTLLAIASIWSTAAVMALIPIVGLYLITLFAVAATAPLERQGVQQRLWLPLVFAVIHFTWGFGAFVQAITLGRWPGRALLFNIRKPVAPILAASPSKSSL